MATALAVPFCDADTLHSAAAVARMAGGAALDDQARAPWLERVGDWLAAHEASGGVVACSALARRYRDRLAARSVRVRFVLLTAGAADIRRRSAERRGHFMPVSLLDDQLRIYEPPCAGERAIRVDAIEGPAAVAEQALVALR